MKLIITCEHGGNDIPKPYEYLFKKEKHVLKTHQGFDLGALDIFEYLKPLSVYSKSSKTSRLLIELNRSRYHPKLFSIYTKRLDLEEKGAIITNYYHPYRNEVESEIAKLILNNENVVHLSIHSFTPHLNGIERHCDIGLLYDSRKRSEKEFSAFLKTQIKTENSGLNVRFNYPYLGKADGFTSYLRQRFTQNYIGIEIEVNQKFSKSNVMDSILKHTLYSAIQSVIFN
ncbi:N-formylglutamate amidohydrolase [Psychroserpens mesophilus]|uniref:N-formylglutamate amidohydrolase n=1 Tax=Psychroserpens mesophilus TaxID=325473 RepID=UPI003D659A7C